MPLAFSWFSCCRRYARWKHGSNGQIQRLCSGAEPSRFDLGGENAYQILRVAESSSLAEIKFSFRKIAKETHPDLVGSTSESSYRFIQILAAYEILSDSSKRSHYDNHLLCQRKLMNRPKEPRSGSSLHVYKFHTELHKPLEVVEWLKWYRLTIKEIVSVERESSGTGYLDELEADFYSAMRTAYYGPEIESMDHLPARFEVEERSMNETPEILHLVSGRDVFGMVCLANDIPSLSGSCIDKVESPSSPKYIGNREPKIHHWFSSSENENAEDSDAYKSLELYISGRRVALANRVPPLDDHDKISVFFCSSEEYSNISLGILSGLGTVPDDGFCYFHNSSGTKTHVVVKHRTLMVSHIHWYGLGDDVSFCECRCSRAKLPPSKFWLFEPRCEMHDIGGWYVETFGKNKKGKNAPSSRQWDNINEHEPLDQRLHPAVYLLTLAYRTLDREDAKRRKKSLKNIAGAKISQVLQWCRKLV